MLKLLNYKLNYKTVLLGLLLSANVFAGSSDLGGSAGVPASEKGAPNGVATLDGTGKVPAAQLPGGGGGGSVTTVSVVSANGLAGTVANPTTTPAITLSSSVNGLVKGNGTTLSAAVAGTDYLAPFAGTTLQYVRGDGSLATLNTAIVPELTNLYYTSARFAADLATKSTTDLAEGTNLYYTAARFNTAFGTKTTDDLTEGVTNLYFTAARAKAAAVADAIVNGVVDVAPSQNAVFDALALKEDLANKDTDGTLAANSDTKYASQKATKTYVDTSVGAVPAAWKLSGNAGTGGASVVGTTDAQPWTTTVNGIFVEGYQTDGQVSSILNVTPVDGTNFRQRNWQTNLIAGAATTTANFRNIDNSVGYGGTGFDYAGSIYNITNGVSHSGAEHIGGMGAVSNTANFSGGGHTDTVKNNDSNVGVTGPYTIDNFVGSSSYLNATQLSGDGNAFQGGVQLTDSNMNNFYLYSGNLNLSGTSTFSSNASLFGTNLHLTDTASVSNAFGTNFGVQLSDSSVAAGIFGNNFSVNLQNSSVVSGQTYGQSNGITLENAATSNGVIGNNVNIQLKNTSSSGNAQAQSLGIFMQDTATASSAVGSSNYVQLQGGNVVPNVTGATQDVSIQGTSDVTNLTGEIKNLTLNGAATSSGMAGFRYNNTIDNTAVMSGTFQGGEINMQTNGGTTVSQAQGLKVNMNGVNLSPAALAAGAQKQALSLEDGSLSAGYNYTVPGASSFFQTHYIGGSVVVASGDPTAAFGFGTNLAQSVVTNDNWALDGSGLGYVDVGFVGSMGIGAGTTMARWTGALGGAGDASSGAGSTLTDAIMFRAAGILPQGGSLAVTNMYGFQVDPNLFGLVGTNKWGFYENNSGVENAMNRLAIGTSNQKVTSGFLFDVNGKIFAEDALVGKQIATPSNPSANTNALYFKSDDNLYMLNSAGTETQVNGGGGGSVTAVTATAPVASSGGATPDISMAASTNAVDGYLTAADHTSFAAKQDAISTSAAVANQFVTGFTAPNTFTRAQPAFTDLSGSVAATQMPALTGDITSSAGTVATTLATVNGSPGSFGSASNTLTATVNGKGLVTAMSATAIAIAESQVTNLTTDLAAKQDAKMSVVDGGDAAYSILAADNHIRSGTTLTADRTYTLPACAGGNVGEYHVVKNLASQTFNIILAANGADTIDGVANVTIIPGNSKSVICGANTAWDIQ